jgi:hypothetical protein
MTRRLSLLVALALAVTACTDDVPTEIPEPEVVAEVETCDGVIDIAVDYVHLMFAELPTAPRDVVTGAEAPTPRLAALQEIGEVLDERAVRLACDPLELRSEVNERIADLDSDHPVVSLFLDIVREEGVVPSTDG